MNLQIIAMRNLLSIEYVQKVIFLRE